MAKEKKENTWLEYIKKVASRDFDPQQLPDRRCKKNAFAQPAV